MRLPRQTQQAEGGAAGQRLDIAAGLGGGVAAEVEKARKKAAEEQKKVTQEQFDKEVQANTAAKTDAGAERTMTNRRAEYIQTQAKKEAEGKTTLDDINKTLQDALAKLTSAPLVS
jgi:3-methyladenine DNA glycosylase/8-oxoguanine DNA glycosylase